MKAHCARAHEMTELPVFHPFDSVPEPDGHRTGRAPGQWMDGNSDT